MQRLVDILLRFQNEKLKLRFWFQVVTEYVDGKVEITHTFSQGNNSFLITAVFLFSWNIETLIFLLCLRRNEASG